MNNRRGMKKAQPKASLGEVLRAWRSQQRLTQDQASAAAGVSQTTWSRWERDEAMPDALELQKIVAAADGALAAETLVGAAGAVRAAG